MASEEPQRSEKMTRGRGLVPATVSWGGSSATPRISWGGSYSVRGWRENQLWVRCQQPQKLSECGCPKNKATGWSKTTRSIRSALCWSRAKGVSEQGKALWGTTASTAARTIQRYNDAGKRKRKSPNSGSWQLICQIMEPVFRINPNYNQQLQADVWGSRQQDREASAGGLLGNW